MLKDNNAAVYWPEFGFNGIGDFTPCHVYQVKFGTTLFNYTYPIIGENRLEIPSGLGYDKSNGNLEPQA